MFARLELWDMGYRMSIQKYCTVIVSNQLFCQKQQEWTDIMTRMKTFYQYSSHSSAILLEISYNFQLNFLVNCKRICACILCMLYRLIAICFTGYALFWSNDYCLFYLAANNASCWEYSNQNVSGFKSSLWDCAMEMNCLGIGE